MINIKQLNTMKIPEGVEKFMKAYGGNHVSLLNAWNNDMTKYMDRDFVEKQLAYAVQNKISKPLVFRILGRLRALCKQEENTAVEALYDDIVNEKDWGPLA